MGFFCSTPDLAGKVVVITGASGGLGEALAHEYYKHGCKVVLCARRKQELDRVREDLLKLTTSGPALHPLIEPLDLGDFKGLPTHASNILGVTGHVDILINNGGMTNRGTVLDTVLDVDINIMNVNYFGTVCFTKAFLPSMIKRKQGNIVNVSSVQGLIAIPERSSYSASKHALQAFSDCLRAEVSQHNIFVTIVSPGYIKTQFSMNALTASGEKHNQMDATTENGYEADYVAQEMYKAVCNGSPELVIAPINARAAIFLRPSRARTGRGGTFRYYRERVCQCGTRVVGMRSTPDPLRRAGLRGNYPGCSPPLDGPALFYNVGSNADSNSSFLYNQI